LSFVPDADPVVAFVVDAVISVVVVDVDVVVVVDVVDDDDDGSHLSCKISHDLPRTSAGLSQSNVMLLVSTRNDL
jgi:hypothetical protein